MRTIKEIDNEAFTLMDKVKVLEEHFNEVVTWPKTDRKTLDELKMIAEALSEANNRMMELVIEKRMVKQMKGATDSQGNDNYDIIT